MSHHQIKKNGIMINVNVSVKSIVCANKIIVVILAHVLVRYLKSIVDDSVIVCYVTDSVYYISKCHEYCINKF